MNKSALIIGNGPSTKMLVDFGLTNLPKNVDTFGMGAAYRYFKQANWWPKYYVMGDCKLVKCHLNDLVSIIHDDSCSVEKFFLSVPITKSEKLEIIEHCSTGDYCFNKAIELGYKNIYLIGIEGQYVENLPNSRALTEEEFSASGLNEVFEIYKSAVKNKSESEAYEQFKQTTRVITELSSNSPNYFFNDYQLPGDLYSVPRSFIHQKNWKKSKELALINDCLVYNLSDRSSIKDFNFISCNEFCEKELARNRLQSASDDLISVIVPVYNVEKYIHQALVSLSLQDDKNYEVVVVIDGSTDSSEEICREFCKNYNNFWVVSQQNLGLGGARNKGISISNGKFITFIDSDDFVSNDYISKLRQKQVETNADVVSSDFCYTDESGELINKSWISNPPKDLKLSGWQKILGQYSPSVAWGRLYRKELFISNDITFPNHMPHEDLFFTYKALAHSEKAVSIKDKTYFYRQRDGSLSKNISKKHIDAFVAIFNDTESFLKKRPFSNLNKALHYKRSLNMLRNIDDRVKNSSESINIYWRDKVKHFILELFNAISLVNEVLGPNAVSVQNLNCISKMNSSMESLSQIWLGSEDFSSYPSKEYFKKKFTGKKDISSFRQKYRGQRCFIIGNGPSLNSHDLSLLKDEVTFAVNSFYLKTQETGFFPTFYLAEDSKVIEENKAEILSYNPKYKIFPSTYMDVFPENDNTFFINANWGYYVKKSPNYCVPRFSVDAGREVFCGQTVTYLSMQLAFYMGFSEVYLIGMDFDYIIPAEHIVNGNLITSTTDDPNHFHKDYFGKGKTWKDPKLDRVATSYRMAKIIYESVGRKIYNATNGGKLNIFPSVDYLSLLSD